ncbi:MAG: hypothetical protein IJ623_09630 [Bacteroidales bacterium]|nr:hypothetical protein [Bacteroidales bacterium]
MKTDPKTYILHLTVEEFIEALKENIPQLGAASKNTEENPQEEGRSLKKVSDSEVPENALLIIILPIVELFLFSRFSGG